MMRRSSRNASACQVDACLNGLISPSSRWSERSWFFAVPLSSLKSPDDVSRNVVKPVAALLGDKKPEQALSGTDAVTWMM